MTPAHTDSPLRRSGRDNAQNQLPQHNDDEEERREARRRTLNSSIASEDASIVEQSETLKKCLAIFHENKLSRDNAWSLSLIDTVSTLLARHHKSLNNFTVAGSSLEASSKVYGLRVDSVHTDVLRMSAGLNARKFRGNGVEDEDDDDGVATGGEGGADPNSSANTGADPENAAENAQKKRKAKRTRKAVATVTKNKESLNARPDTVPLQDPVFGKLNSVVGSINASNRLMNNILHSVDAELRLRMTHKFWDSSHLNEDCDYTVPVPLDNIPDKDMLPCERLCKIERYENQLLRPMMSGYEISDTPDRSGQDKEPMDLTSLANNANAINGNNEGEGDDVLPEIERQRGVGGDVSMAFDMDAECEPLPMLNSYAPIIAVDEQDYDDFTAEEHNAIGNCRGLRRSAVVIEDMRPVDSVSNLEYSYRPVEKISQFWAGPSHWRFRRTRNRISALGQTRNSQQIEPVGRTLNPRNRKVNALQSKKRVRVQFSAPIHDAQFVKIDAKFKARKANFQKKWDQRKLRLPTDLQLQADTLVNFRFFAPALTAFNVGHNIEEDDDDVGILTPQLDDEDFNADVGHNMGTDNDIFGADIAIQNDNDPNDMNAADAERISSFTEDNHMNATNNPANDTVLEIATDFEGAPRQVTKIIVPFAKRAKVIDMKTLKRTCSHLISTQLKQSAVAEQDIPQHPVQKTEKYSPGVGSFKEVFSRLPPLLTPTMAEGLTPSIALYSVLHLANDCNYRLIPRDDLSDFYIRQVLDE